jgi:hypothetical protein
LGECRVAGLTVATRIILNWAELNTRATSVLALLATVRLIKPAKARTSMILRQATGSTRVPKKANGGRIHNAAVLKMHKNCEDILNDPAGEVF